MAGNESERTFLLMFSATDDLVKVSWKLDVEKGQNQDTPLTLTSWVKVASPFIATEVQTKCISVIVTKIYIFIF